MPDRRLKAVWDVQVPVIRELAGVHEYDGIVMDLSPSGRKAALKRLGPSSPGERLADRHDERHLCAAEQAARAEAEAEALQWNPLPHIENLDLSCYDREYAPEPQRRRAREAHLAQWPEAVGASLESLQAVPAPVAGALLPAVRGLAARINGTTGVEVAALEAHTRLLGRIQEAAASGNPDASLGATALARLLRDFFHQVLATPAGDRGHGLPQPRRPVAHRRPRRARRVAGRAGGRGGPPGPVQGRLPVTPASSVSMAARTSRAVSSRLPARRSGRRAGRR